MARTYGTLFLGVSTCFCLLTAVSAFVEPETFGGRLGLALAGADGYNEIRAQYGGFFLAVAVAGGMALAGVFERKAALLVNLVVFGGLIAGRLVSLGLDDGFTGYGTTIRSLYCIDATGCTGAALALALSRRVHRLPAAGVGPREELVGSSAH